jgi:hypothetical protein
MSFRLELGMHQEPKTEMPSDQDGCFRGDMFGTTLPRIERFRSRHRASPAGCRAPHTVEPLLMLVNIVGTNPLKIQDEKNRWSSAPLLNGQACGGYEHVVAEGARSVPGRWLPDPQR